MEAAQLALKLVLDELDIDAAVRTVSERKTVQKGVYLGQLAGVDLGYRYNWYIMGPYSPSLTRDYFALDKAIEAGDTAFEGRELQESVRRRLAKIRPLLDVPSGVNLSKANWLELLSSLHYLLAARRLSVSEAKALLQEKKSHVAPYTDVALEMLQSKNLA